MVASQAYFGAGDELDLTFAFMLRHAALAADQMRGVVAAVDLRSGVMRRFRARPIRGA